MDSHSPVYELATRDLGSASAVLSSPDAPLQVSRHDLPKDQSVVTFAEGTIPDTTTASVGGDLPSANNPSLKLARWNESRLSIFRILALFYSFIVIGANDAAYGALIPYLESYYHLNYTIISLIFLPPVFGTTVAAVTNNQMHIKFGQRGVAVIGSCCHLIVYTVLSLHPPYPVLVVVLVFNGYGTGLAIGAWNAWIGDMAHANEILGFLHGLYGLGAALSPLVATAIVTKPGRTWYQFYYVMLGAAVVETILLCSAFWKASGAVFRASRPLTSDETGESGTSSPIQSMPTQEAVESESLTKGPWYIRINPMKNSSIRAAGAPSNNVTLYVAFFLLIYVGVEVSIGGWIVTFMLRVRGASAFAAGLTSTGFWLGIAIGRLVLGFVTARLFKTEKHAVATYLVLCVAFQLMFWLIPRFEVSAVMVSLLGFFLGPFFPAAVVVLAKLLPKKMHVRSIGLAGAFGAGGACIFPFAVGAIANTRGVQVLQPIILALLLAELGIWIAIPKLPTQRSQNK